MKNFFKKLLIKFKIVKPKKIIDVLFLSYTVLIIVPIVILGLVFTLMSTYQFTEQAKKNDAYVVKSFVNTIGEDMEVIHNITYRLMNDKNVLKLGEYTEYDFEMVSTMKSVKETLQSSVIETELINEIYLFYRESGFTVGSNLAKYDNSFFLLTFSYDGNGI